MSTATVELIPRQHLAQVILAAKARGMSNPDTCASLADAIIAGLERRGYVIASEEDIVDPPDEHLRTLKYMRKTVRDTIESIDSARDISSLTKRLGDISKEIIAVEERIRVDAKSATKARTRTKTNGAAAHPKGTSKSGQIDI